MGSWNNTCQISQLPIHAGEPVRYMILTKCAYNMDSFVGHGDRSTEPNSGAGREGVYSGNFWYPEFVPVRAKYNDYGSVEKLDEECLNWQFWQNSINERLVEIEQGPNPYHDPPSKKGMALEQLLDVLQEGRLRFKSEYYDMVIPVCQTMIREDVYQSLLALPLEETWWMDKGADKFTPESIYNHGMKLFTEPAKIRPGLEGFEDLADMLEDDDFKNYFVSSMRDNEGERGLKPYRLWIRKALKSGEFKIGSDEFKALIKDIADFMYVKTVHSHMRMGWHPGVGMGSQSSNLKMANTFHRNLAKIATSVRKAQQY